MEPGYEATTSTPSTVELGYEATMPFTMEPGYEAITP